MSRSGRKTLPKVREWWEALTDAWEGLGGPHGCPGVVGTPFRMFGSCREPFKDVREWSGHPSGCLGVVRRPSRTAERAS